MIEKVDFYEILGDLLETIFGSKIIQKGVPKTRPNWTSENEKVWVARFEKEAQKGANMESQSEKHTKNTTRIREEKCGLEK